MSRTAYKKSSGSSLLANKKPDPDLRLPLPGLFPGAVPVPTLREGLMKHLQGTTLNLHPHDYDIHTIPDPMYCVSQLQPSAGISSCVLRL